MIGGDRMKRLDGAPETLDEDQKRLYDAIAAGPRGRVKGPLAMWLNSPKFCERAQHLGEHLRFNNLFPKKWSEMIIILTAAHHRCDYEWRVHAGIAIREGLPESHVASIKEGRRPDDMQPDQESIYDFATGLLRENRVSDEVYSAFESRYGAKGIVEITGLIGYYQIGAHLLNATEFLPDDGVSDFGRDP
ncbi:MAG: carboxymuconolactone decarboxylase family protein [Boseongicola sp. SB0664_bin_43]|uniref:Carboxymuconolactone decarboxylase family protein n=1 Tax=Boseongicola sp. SB0664_bin_43 TaxID=2604844 RepID=A0A6B0XZR5_9RHOB|nr:carboxymuconolactone decarboxylase family protein [Boseongicola sp. SB0664_bin_43]